MSHPDQRYRAIFEHTPVALWDEDLTELFAELDRLGESGITNWPGYFDDHPEVVGQLAAMTRILDVNEYSVKLYKAESKEELLGSIDRTFDPQSFPVFKRQLVSMARGELFFQAEAYSRTLQGDRLHVFLQLRVLNDGDRKRGLLSLIDISQRKKMELALREINKELERSNQELEHFAYVASHDLQEPLRMIASYTQLLARRYQGEIDERADKYIHYIVDGARRMQELVSDLLELSRAGTKARTLRPTDCEEVVVRSLRNMRIALEESKAQVTYDELPIVVYDPTQLGQLFQNLISNAVKFRREETPQVHISARKEERDWIISVQDNGIGIPPEQVDTIFEVFRRLHARDEYPGTGVGLAIAKKIVERHGGDIWLDSTLGLGTTFYFSVRAVS